MNISEDERQANYQRFLSFTTKNEQDAYLQSLIHPEPIKRRRRRKPAEESNQPERGSTYLYSITLSTRTVQVCKQAFLNLHGVTQSRVWRLTALLSQNKTPQDMRGKSTPGNAKPGATLDAVKEHISSFPVEEAHYTNREYKYLNERLNVKIMHTMFKTKYPDLNVTYDYYLKIFNISFGYSFGRPQVDTCGTCEALDTKFEVNS